MRTAVPHEPADLVHALQNARFHQPLCVVAADRRVHILHFHAGTDDREQIVRGRQHAFVQNALALGEFSVARPRARNVGDHAVILRAHIVQDHVAILRLTGVAIVVDAEIVLSAGDDRRETGAVGAVLRKRVVKIRLVLVFVFSGMRRAHHGKNAFARDRLRLAQRFDLARLLDEPQRAEDVLCIADREIGKILLDAAKQTVRRTVGLLGRVAVEVEIDLFILSAACKRGKVALKGLNAARVAYAGDFFRFLGSYANARPALGERVRRQKIQPLLNAAVRILCGEQHGRLAFQARQVYKIAVGKKGKVFIAALPKLISRENSKQAPCVHVLIQSFAVVDII